MIGEAALACLLLTPKMPKCEDSFCYISCGSSTYYVTEVSEKPVVSTDQQLAKECIRIHGDSSRDVGNCIYDLGGSK